MYLSLMKKKSLYVFFFVVSFTIFNLEEIKNEYSFSISSKLKISTYGQDVKIFYYGQQYIAAMDHNTE